MLCVSHLNAIGRRFLNFQKNALMHNLKACVRYSYVPSLLQSLEGDVGR